MRWPSSTSRPASSSTRRPRTAGRPWSTSWARSSAAATDPERPGIVHRLDKGTSGLLVVARGDEAPRRPPGAGAPARGRARLPRPRPRPPRLPHRDDRRADRPRRRASATAWRSPAPPRARRGPTSPCWSCSPRETYLEVAPGDRPHAPDPRPPRRDRPPAGRRRHLRRRARYGLDRPVPPRPPARLHASRRAARGWPSPPSCRPISPPLSSPPAPPSRRHPTTIPPSLNRPPPQPPRILTGAEPGPRARAAGPQPPIKEIHRNARGRPQRAAGGRGPLRPPDASLEPEHAPLHLRRAGRDPHHRPDPDRGAAGERPPLRRRAGQRRRHGALRRHQEAGARRRSRNGPNAARCPTSTSAGWAAC